MSRLRLDDLLPNLNNAGRRLVLSEIVGRPKAYTLSRPTRISLAQQKESIEATESSSLKKTQSP